MSAVLARIRVRETHGIRRFLYPLSTRIHLPKGIDTALLGWSGTRGDAVPLQILPATDQKHQTDFALSLAPMEERTLELVTGGFQFPIPDALHIQTTSDSILHSRQERVSFDISGEGGIQQVTYDGIPHLREPSGMGNIIFLGSAQRLSETTYTETGPLTTRVINQGTHFIKQWAPESQNTWAGQMPYSLVTEITACKSWVKQIFSCADHSGLMQFNLDLSTSAIPLLCDFGIGGGLYGKLTPAVNLELWIGKVEVGVRQWKLSVIDEKCLPVREECRGVSTPQWQSEMWFHLIDKDKSLAVALTQVPDTCNIRIHLTASGQITVEFEGKDREQVEFGVCYHFLNDVPAIAAATNPQSILLPPVVEVLPV